MKQSVMSLMFVVFVGVIYVLLPSQEVEAYTVTATTTSESDTATDSETGSDTTTGTQTGTSSQTATGTATNTDPCVEGSWKTDKSPVPIEGPKRCQTGFVKCPKTSRVGSQTNVSCEYSWSDMQYPSYEKSSYSQCVNGGWKWVCDTYSPSPSENSFPVCTTRKPEDPNCKDKNICRSWSDANSSVKYWLYKIVLGPYQALASKPQCSEDQLKAAGQ